MNDTVNLANLDLSDPGELRHFYHTTIKVVDPKTGELTRYDGPVVGPSDDFDAAQDWCNKNGFPFAVVDGVIEQGAFFSKYPVEFYTYES